MKKSFIGALLLVAGAVAVGLVVAHQRDALRRIVQEQCVPGLRKQSNPFPCERVVLASSVSEDDGYAILHDRKGGAHFLLIPTRTLPGIESAALLDPAAPDYVAAAWNNRDLLERWLGRALPRDAVGLAINPRAARSQDQLHIHMECVGALLQQAVRTQADVVGSVWTPFTVADRHFQARRIMGDDFRLADPIRLLASELPDARPDLGLYTVIVAGHTFTKGPGVVVLVGTGAVGGESLLDSRCETVNPTRRH